jgi:small conductance mechanosensitive channel
MRPVGAMTLRMIFDHAPGETPPAGPDAITIVRRTLETMWADTLERLPFVAIAIVVLVIFWVIAKVVRAGVGRVLRGSPNAAIGLVIGRLSYFLLVILGLLVALTIVVPSMTPGRLVSLLGIGGVAIGFAFKDVLQNLLAGVLILIRQPFRIGDEITSGSFTGTVEGIETRATLIKTYDGRRIIVPNSVIFTAPVSVITAYDMLRTEYDVGIGYGDDVATAKEIILGILRETDGVLADPAPDVVAWDLAECTLNLRARWWSKPDRPTVVRLRDVILGAIRVQLPAAGIDLPFPTRVVLFHDQTEETDGDRARQREGWPAGKSPPRAAGLSAAVRRLAPLGSKNGEPPPA